MHVVAKQEEEGRRRSQDPNSYKKMEDEVALEKDKGLEKPMNYKKVEMEKVGGRTEGGLASWRRHLGAQAGGAHQM